MNTDSVSNIIAIPEPTWYKSDYNDLSHDSTRKAPKKGKETYLKQFRRKTLEPNPNSTAIDRLNNFSDRVMKHLTGQSSKNSFVKKPKPAPQVPQKLSDRSEKNAIATGITIQSLHQSKYKNKVSIEMKEG